MYYLVDMYLQLNAPRTHSLQSGISKVMSTTYLYSDVRLDNVQSKRAINFFAPSSHAFPTFTQNPAATIAIEQVYMHTD